MGRRSGIHQRQDGRWYARYKKGENVEGKARYGYIYGQTKEEVERRLAEFTDRYPTSLNLLILGAGTHGRDVKEIAESLHMFEKIAFLDDAVVADDVIGKCKDLYVFRNEYPCAFIAIGDSETRKKYAEELRRYHFLIPRIVAPSAVLSPNAKIGEGTVVMQQANVGAAEIEEFCIVAQGSMISSEATIGEYALIDSGGIVARGAVVPAGFFVNSGETFAKDGLPQVKEA